MNRNYNDISPLRNILFCTSISRLILSIDYVGSRTNHQIKNY